MAQLQDLGPYAALVCFQYVLMEPQRDALADLGDGTHPSRLSEHALARPDAILPVETQADMHMDW